MCLWFDQQPTDVLTAGFCTGKWFNGENWKRLDQVFTGKRQQPLCQLATSEIASRHAGDRFACRDNATLSGVDTRSGVNCHGPTARARRHYLQAASLLCL